MAVYHQREKIYQYGGVRLCDENHTPTCDFYCLDLKTVVWKNLTVTYFADPFLKDPPNFAVRQLPALSEPAITLASVNDSPFLFIFGGHNGDNPTSDLIAIDVDLHIWWFVDVQGTSILPRMCASMVTINNQIFIFRGRTDFDDTSPAIRTYLIANYHPETRWTWKVSDGPMPPDLPPLGFSIQAAPIYGGQKILLAQGRLKNDDPIELSRETTISFHTHNHTFQDARGTMGAFPRGVAWYQMYSVVPGARPRNPEAESPRHSVVIFAWVKHKGALVPEGWQYLLPPAERIRCLNLRDKVEDLELDLQAFATVGNRLVLLGRVPTQKAAPVVEDGQMMVDEEDLDELDESPDSRWDVTVELSCECLME
ncbi:hypothetical protein C8R44DRAFT_711873 [Mycena epipterygia]|nr:hypothetical protein C8R44DRAFT_711873 [Mycena epipterygia]